MTVTHIHVISNSGCHVPTGVSTQEEGDIIMILRAAEIAGKCHGCFTAFIDAAEFLLYLLSLEKAHNHQLRWSSDVKNYSAQSSALNNYTLYSKQRL